MDDDIQANLDAYLRKLLENALRERDSADAAPAFGVGKPYFVYFILGILYADIQTYFVDLYKSRGIATEETLRADFQPYWKKNVESIIKQLEEIYGL